MATQIGRREVLRAGLVAGVALAVASCGGGKDGADERTGETPVPTGDGTLSAAPSGGTSPSGAGAGGPYPAYKPITAIKADMPAEGDGMALFLEYPADPEKVVSQAPGKGGDVSAYVSLNGAAPPVKSARWDELNKRLNATLKFNAVPDDDFNSKLATIIAGGEVPDIVQLKDGAVQRLPDLLENSFADLTPHLGGDAVSDYPALANIPTPSWRSCVYNGKLFAVPQPRGFLKNGMLVRLDLLRSRGLPTEVATAEDFLALCQELTDERKNQWAVGSGSGMLNMLQQMHGVPNEWEQKDADFTSAYETDEMRQALAAAAKMWKSGVMNPDSWAANATTIGSWFLSGSVPIFPGVNWGNIYAYYTLDAGHTKGLDLGLFGPVPAAGSTTSYWTGPGYWGFSAVKKASEDRVRELLGVINYLASPFGSEEWMFINYGLPGADYELQGADPVAKPGLTDRVPTGSITNAPQVMYHAGLDEVMKRAYAYQQQWMTDEHTAADPSVGLVSDTKLASGPQLTKAIGQVQVDVAQGRKTLDDWDAAVQKWLSGGGDAMKKELGAAWKAANS